MGKSVRSKIKRKFRAKRRAEIYKPVENERRYRSLMNLARSQHSQSAHSKDIDVLKAALGTAEDENLTQVGQKVYSGDDKPTIDDSAELAANAVPVLEKHAKQMAEAEARAVAKKNDHFSFLEKEEIPAWRVTTSKPHGSAKAT